jgi:hypothetical protein
MATAAPGPRLYRSRRPERTLLYRALADQFERFLAVYEGRFERTHGFLRRSVEKAVYRYLDCGIFAHGAARAHCAECGHDVPIAFSCKLRCLCPSCHQKRELLWIELASELLAEVPHRQAVSAVPKRLRILCCIGDRSRCSASSVSIARSLVSCPTESGGRTSSTLRPASTTRRLCSRRGRLRPDRRRDPGLASASSRRADRRRLVAGQHLPLKVLEYLASRPAR